MAKNPYDTYDNETEKWDNGQQCKTRAIRIARAAIRCFSEQVDTTSIIEWRERAIIWMDTVDTFYGE